MPTGLNPIRRSTSSAPFASLASDGDSVIAAPGYQERVLFLGANGSGKTVLASEMMRDYPRVVVLDVKGDFPIPWAKGEYVVADSPMGQGSVVAREKWLRNRVIWRPSKKYRSSEWYAWWLDQLLDRARREGKKRPFVCYVDEGLFIAKERAKDSLGDLAITGRSLGLGLWVASQRPRGIPVAVRSEAWRIYLFFLQQQDDEDELIKLTRRQLNRDNLFEGQADYSFWEIRRGVGGRVNVRHLPPIALAHSRPAAAG